MLHSREAEELIGIDIVYLIYDLVCLNLVVSTSPVNKIRQFKAVYLASFQTARTQHLQLFAALFLELYLSAARVTTSG